MENPIIDNRIVHDASFALRLNNFIKKVNVCDMASEEEKDYLLFVANRLLQYQVKTATDVNEINYLTLNGLIQNYTNR